jgi:hypothetical protein
MNVPPITVIAGVRSLSILRLALTVKGGTVNLEVLDTFTLNVPPIIVIAGVRSLSRRHALTVKGGTVSGYLYIERTPNYSDCMQGVPTVHKVRGSGGFGRTI